MPRAHRHGDSRVCGATTIVQNQATVTIDGQLWATQGDENSHGGGGLINSISSVTIAGIPIIVLEPDDANQDNLCPVIGEPHCNPKTSSACASVTVGGD